MLSIDFLGHVSLKHFLWTTPVHLMARLVERYLSTDNTRMDFSMRYHQITPDSALQAMVREKQCGYGWVAKAGVFR
jgi:hypothetical protein